MTDRGDMGVPPGSIEVEVDGVRLAVAREGQGPLVVCLHAAGHGARDYEAFAALMTPAFEILRIDWPGHGRSGEDMREDASAGRYADLLTGLLAKLEIERPIIVGNSIGGAAAIIHAARSQVRALVLCDPGGLVPAGPLSRVYCSAFRRFFQAGVRDAKWYGPAFRLYYHIVLPSLAAVAQRNRIIANAYQSAPLLEQVWRSFSRPNADIRVLAAVLTAPIWVAWARSDRVIPARLCMPTVRRLRHAELSFFAGGHAPFLEQPEAFATAFEAFIGRLELVDGIAGGVPVRESLSAK